MLRPWVLAAVAAACAVVAVAIPRRPWADDIDVVEVDDMTTSITVQVDHHRVVVHAPEGYAIQRWGQSSEPSVELTMVGDGGPVQVHIGPGRGAISDEGRLRRAAVAEEIVAGATMTVLARLPDEVVQRMFDELEIS